MQISRSDMKEVIRVELQRQAMEIADKERNFWKGAQLFDSAKIVDKIDELLAGNWKP